MNTTINISLPKTLRNQAQELVNIGIFSSFGDFVRSAIRDKIEQVMTDWQIAKIEQEVREGKATVVKSDEDLKMFFTKIEDEVKAEEK